MNFYKSHCNPVFLLYNKSRNSKGKLEEVFIMDNNNNNNNNSNDFNTLTDTAKGVWNAITRTTDDFFNSSKAKLQKANLQSQVKDAYTRLGNAVYDSKRSGQNNDEIIGLIFNEIDSLKAQLDQLDQQIDACDNINRCPQCGAANPIDSKFCAQCGAPLPEVVKPQDTAESCDCTDGTCGCGDNTTPDYTDNTTVNEDTFPIPLTPVTNPDEENK